MLLQFGQQGLAHFPQILARADLVQVVADLLQQRLGVWTGKVDDPILNIGSVDDEDDQHPFG